MSTAEILDTTDEQDASLDDLLALFDEMDARETAEGQRARMREIGAPAHLAFDLSDAAHDCISDDEGKCAACAAGGTPMLANNHSKYL